MYRADGEVLASTYNATIFKLKVYRMKQNMLFFATIAIWALSFINSATLSQGERKKASALLEETRDNLLKKISGLSQVQLNFKPNASAWSIAECLEHITVSENTFFDLTQTALKEPADPSKRTEIKMSDEALVNSVMDRSTKRKTQEMLEPSGKFGGFEGTLQEFKTKRERNIIYIKTTVDDLRNHYNDFPFGKLDTYQTILLMAAHSKRHTDQIVEILNHPDFPKKGK